MASLLKNDFYSFRYVNVVSSVTGKDKKEPGVLPDKAFFSLLKWAVS